MAKLIAKKRIPYRGRMLNPGDEFDVSCLRTKRALIALGKATPAPRIDAEIEVREEPQPYIESEPDPIESEQDPDPIESEPDPIKPEPDPIESSQSNEPEKKPEDPGEILPENGKKRRVYKRRDMIAEEIKKAEDD